MAAVPQFAAGALLEEIKKMQQITSSSSSAYDHFGTVVAVNGDILAVGSPQSDSNWEDSGAVYVYEKSGQRWKFIKKIQAKPRRQYGLFGYAVAIEGAYLIIGEPGFQYDQKGYVHVFSRNQGGKSNWGRVRSIERKDDCRLKVRDRFGESLSIHSGMLLVGAPKTCRSREDWMKTTGAAYLYSGYGANFIKKLTAHNGDDSDSYGSSTSLCGQYAFVGAPMADSGTLRPDSGAAYIYNKAKNWGLHKYINPHDTVSEDKFSSSIACSGDYAAIGAPGTSSAYGSDTSTSAVYIYKKDKGGSGKWGLKKKIQETDLPGSSPDTNNLFGQSLAISSNFLIIGFGESSQDNKVEDPAAHIFTLLDGNWKRRKGIFNSMEEDCSTSSYDKGFSVATDGKTFVIGDMEDESTMDTCVSGRGKVEIYNRSVKKVISLPPIYLLLR